MKRGTLLWRSIYYHRRASMAVGLGVLVGAAVLTGALIVGDSVRYSLRAMALNRLGDVHLALRSGTFFRAKLADSFDDKELVTSVAPIISLSGSAREPVSGSRRDGVSVFGIDQRFPTLQSAGASFDMAIPESGQVVLNQPLAEALGVSTGDFVLVQVGKPSAIALDTLLGNRDDTTTGLRLEVSAIVPSDGLGALSLDPRQSTPLNAFVSLGELLGAIDREGRANTLLFGAPSTQLEGSSVAGDLRDRLARSAQLADFGLTLRKDGERGYVSLESESMLIGSAIESAALQTAQSLSFADGAEPKVAPILTYLANTIALVHDSDVTESATREIPYSTVSAVPPDFFSSALAKSQDDAAGAALSEGAIVLTQWAADDLQAKQGDRVRLTYYVTREFGDLETKASTFTVAGVLPDTPDYVDTGFTPHFPGITDARTMAEWEPPFPVDMTRIRQKDDDWWEEHRAAPKAFITLAEGQRLWTAAEARFGDVTSVRVYPPDGVSLDQVETQWQSALVSEIDPEAAGLVIDPVRDRALRAGTGSTDFGGLFIGFSFFLILSAAMLVALLFRLGVERRASEVGLLLAVGFPTQSVLRGLLIEGAIIAVGGGIAGLLLARVYAWLMLSGLRSWWSAAVNAPFLELHDSVTSYAIGLVGAIVLSLGAIAWSLRGLKRQSTRALLAGAIGSSAIKRDGAGRSRRWLLIGTFAIVAVGLIASHVITGKPSDVIAFFGGGAAALVATLILVSNWLYPRRLRSITQAGSWSAVRLGVRNAPRHAGRGKLTIALIGCATFVIAALQSFYIQPERDAGRHSPTGGFPLYAESAVPVPFDLNSPEGRERLVLAPSTRELLKDVTVIPFRLRPGEDTSCLNLYLPTQPRILGVPDAMIERGGFRFGATQAETNAERENPWRLLNKSLPDGAIPVIGDEAAVKWQLHLGLGQTLTLETQRGDEVTLRFVGLLKGSALQGELLIAASAFRDCFPNIEAPSFFLIDVPAKKQDQLGAALEKDLQPYGFDVAVTADRLRDYFAVQNTYLSTFQTLGGLGLVLGALGLTAVLLRNVWERRSELALMRAIGFSRRKLGVMVLAENAALVVSGLVAGFLPAMVAVAPHLAEAPGAFPWATIGLTLAGVLVVGLGAGALALVPTLRAPMIQALRSE